MWHTRLAGAYQAGSSLRLKAAVPQAGSCAPAAPGFPRFPSAARDVPGPGSYNLAAATMVTPSYNVLFTHTDSSGRADDGTGADEAPGAEAWPAVSPMTPGAAAS